MSRGSALTCLSEGTLPNALTARSIFSTTAGISTAVRSLRGMAYRGAPFSVSLAMPCGLTPSPVSWPDEAIAKRISLSSLFIFFFNLYFFGR